MNIARDRITGKLIVADAGAIARHRRYECAECKALVVFCPLGRMVAHFRHGRGKSSDRCSLYHAPFGQDLRQLVSSRPRRLFEPKLCLRIVEKSGTRLHWEPCLLIPKFERATLFSLSETPSSARIDVASIEEGGTPYPVYPTSDDYIITLYEPGEKPEELPLSGFSEPSIFRFSLSLCRRLDDYEPLTPGTPYVVVRRTHEAPKAIPPSIQHRLIGLNADWSAYALLVPASPSSSEMAWIRQHLKRTIIETEVTASILAPVEAFQLPDGVWAIPASNAITVVAGIDFGTTAPSPRTLTVVNGVSKTTEPLIVGTGQQLFLRTHLPPGLHEIRMGRDDEALLTILVGPVRRPPSLQLIEFVFDGEDDLQTLSLWDAKLPGQLSAVAENRASLVTVSLPPRATVRVHTKDNVNHEFTAPADSEVAGHQAGEEMKRLLETELKSPKPNFVIDGGGFGRLAFPVQIAQPPPRTSAPVSGTIASRLQWLKLVDRKPQWHRGPAATGRLRAHYQQLSRWLEPVPRQ